MNKATGTREWSNSSLNISSGCSNDCKYCYAKTQAIRFKRKTAENWHEEEIDRNKLEKKFGKRDGVVMFPTTHDITCGTYDACMAVLRKLLRSKNQVLIVSKPRYDLSRHMLDLFDVFDADLFLQKRVLFRFTIGSFRDDTLHFWEPGAPPFGDRIASLVECHLRGWRTSVSCEPMLGDRLEMIELVQMVSPYVTDSIWLGKMNMNAARVKINGGSSGDIDRARQLGSTWNDTEVNILYQQLCDHPLVRWKESIKKVVGIELNEEAGMDK